MLCEPKYGMWSRPLHVCASIRWRAEMGRASAVPRQGGCQTAAEGLVNVALAGCGPEHIGGEGRAPLVADE